MIHPRLRASAIFYGKCDAIRYYIIMKRHAHSLMAMILLVFTALVIAAASPAAPAKDEDPYAPHTPTLIYYLTGLKDQSDSDAIHASVDKLKSAKVVEVNPERRYARIRFDSHIVSYHQVAQGLSDAGETLGKKYNPTLIFSVPDYAKSDNAAKVDAIFAGKRLNSRIHVTPIDKTKGDFAVHFLPLKVDPANPAPQGFNGGHLHHPLSDPPPRGLGLPSSYAFTDQPATAPTSPTSQPQHPAQ